MTAASQSLADRKAKAYERFKKGEKPVYSYGMCGSTTAGYGELDYYGYWAYPLDVDQDTLEILPLELWEAWQREKADRNAAQKKLDTHMKDVEKRHQELLERYK